MDIEGNYWKFVELSIRTLFSRYYSVTHLYSHQQHFVNFSSNPDDEYSNRRIRSISPKRRLTVNLRNQINNNTAANVIFQKNHKKCLDSHYTRDL